MSVMKADMTSDFGINPKSLQLGDYAWQDPVKEIAVQKMGGWGFWQDHYYPTIIRESYPVYLQEKALDKGKQAFEILKILQDKKLLHVNKVEDFIEAMDTIIKTL